METITIVCHARRRHAVLRSDFFRAAFILGSLVAFSGCVHQSQDQGRLRAPIKTEHDHAVVESETPPNVAELLNEAEKELKKANEAHERGEFDAALEHYQRVLKLLVDANLDPALFYESSEQLEEILRLYMKHAHLYHHPDGRLGCSKSGVYSDIIIPLPLPKPVEDEIAELQQSYSGTFQRGLNRSSRYLPYIKKTFCSEGLPEDLAWLAMVESMFRPEAVSPAGAGGMWQFMRATGRRYNLRMDSYVDERSNWHSSTRAAVEYLKCLHDFFNGDWALAVTAYNMGEGGLSRAMEANGGQRDFWSLIQTPPASERIKEESRKYYPRLLAYIVVANAPEKYGFTCPTEPFEDVERIPVRGCYPLAELDKAMGFSKGTLASLNPDLVQEATPPQGEYPVAVPRDKRDMFLAALQTVKTVQYAAAPRSGASQSSSCGTHRVGRGETIAAIARRYGVDQKELMRANHIRSAKSLQANQVLHIPGLVVAQSSRESTPVVEERNDDVATPSDAVAMRSATYTVKKRDTLSAIARANKTSVTDLEKLNNLKSGGCIRVGQVLKVGVAAAPVQVAARYHEVKPGEYPGVIAKLYGISTSDLLAWNNLNSQSVIRVGDRLVIAGDASAGTAQSTADAKKSSSKKSSEETASKPVVHKVAAGETASQIASRYGVKTADLLASNRLTAKSVLRVGQALTIQNASRDAGQRDRSSDIQVSEAKPKKVVHTVTAGQNPSIIARRYGVSVKDLFKWNNWSEAPVLRIGDEVSIYKD